MTDWNKIADNAADKTDKELENGLSKLMVADTAKLFTNPIDREKVEAMIRVIKAETSYNERVAKFKAISATLGADVLKVVKAAIFGLLLALVASSVNAQEIKTLDLSNPFADSRLGIAWNMQGQSKTVAYVPFVYFQPGGIEYATLNFGITNNNATGEKRYLVSVGPRIDTGLDKISEIPWVKKNFKIIKLPPVQISPTLLTNDFRVYTWWLTIASKFGGK